jgi:hypothetical protein
MPDLPSANTKKNTRFKSSYLDAGELKKMSLLKGTGSAMIGFDHVASQHSGIKTNEDDAAGNLILNSHRQKSKCESHTDLLITSSS